MSYSPSEQVLVGEYILLQINLPTVLILDAFLADVLGLQTPAGFRSWMHQAGPFLPILQLGELRASRMSIGPGTHR